MIENMGKGVAPIPMYIFYKMVCDILFIFIVIEASQ